MTNRAPGEIFDWLLRHQQGIDAAPLPTLADWLPHFTRARAEWAHPADRAIAGGFLADRIAYAFAAGYESALARLVPSLDDGRITALCVTEEGGGHPKAIQTTLTSDGASGWRLSGKKKFVSMAAQAQRLLVAAARGFRDDGRPDLRLIVIDLPAAGVTIEPMKDLPFIPEISHGILHLDGAAVPEDHVLAGDGYADYIKPFRTIEDVHVTAAIIAHAYRTACRLSWPPDLRDRMLSLLMTFRALSDADPSSPLTHILLAGALRVLDGSLAELGPLFDNADDATRSSWTRDSALLGIAGKARAARLERARAQYN